LGVNLKRRGGHASNFNGYGYRFRNPDGFERHRRINRVCRHLGLLLREMPAGLRQSWRQILRRLLQQGAAGQASSENLPIGFVAAGGAVGFSRPTIRCFPAAGPGTRRAIRAFKKNNGCSLEMDGIASTSAGEARKTTT
jgi:hypothetical protein